MGSATWSNKKDGSLGNLRVKIGDLTMSSSYAIGGDAAAPAIFGLQEVLFLDTIPIHAVGVVISPVFSGSPALYQSKIQCFFPTGGAGTTPTTLIAPVGAAGPTTVTSTAATLVVNPGIASEVGSTTNLSTVVVRCIVYGF